MNKGKTEASSGDKHTRHIALDGGVNVRDLGGYRSRDGRQVKWRTILRSGHLNHLSDDDRESFTKLDLRTIHDFRRSPEIEKFPSIVGDINIVSGYELGVGSMGMFMQTLEAEGFTPAEAHTFVVKAYRDCVLDVTGAFRAFFQHLLAQKSGALLFHCMAGKDRTGLAAALILHALDVPSDVIMEDYMLTSHYLPVDAVIENFVRSRDDLAAIIANNRAALVPYCGVHPDNLIAFFQGIDLKFGSIDAYLSRGLALTKTDIADLKERYLS
jgi:protein-tyrosine phosphatase